MRTKGTALAAEVRSISFGRPDNGICGQLRKRRGQCLRRRQFVGMTLIKNPADRQTSAQPGTRISCHAALDEAARAPFSKERRMKFAKATKFHRKSGKGWEIDIEEDPSAVGAALNRSSALCH
jgi:hypothetical protein